jgi:hypothetical protein
MAGGYDELQVHRVRADDAQRARPQGGASVSHKVRCDDVKREAIGGSLMQPPMAFDRPRADMVLSRSPNARRR